MDNRDFRDSMKKIVADEYATFDSRVELFKTAVAERIAIYEKNWGNNQAYIDRILEDMTMVKLRGVKKEGEIIGQFFAKDGNTGYGLLAQPRWNDGISLSVCSQEKDKKLCQHWGLSFSSGSDKNWIEKAYKSVIALATDNAQGGAIELGTIKVTGAYGGRIEFSHYIFKYEHGQYSKNDSWSGKGRFDIKNLHDSIEQTTQSLWARNMVQMDSMEKYPL